MDDLTFDFERTFTDHGGMQVRREGGCVLAGRPGAGAFR